MRVLVNSCATPFLPRHRVCGGSLDGTAEASMNGIMIRLKSAAIAALLALPAAANAQTAGDELSRLFARTEAKHRSSRRNLTEILRNQPRFWIELRAVAERLQTQPAWLLNVMASESLFNPAAHNPLPGQTASGLLQFIEATARRMGTTTEAIRRMSPVEQLRLVERYLTPFRGRLNRLADVYLAVFRGAVIDGGDTVVVVDSNKERRVYALNKSLDLNGDGRIVKGELSLSALSVGRFLPALARTTRVKTDKSNLPAKEDQPPARSTRSIYIRPANHQ
ncbi:MAG: lytic transglycosylase domain-containing protein [Acidobacteria bacterium]|nr:lytic transglycosylase domain-containing protein [Acidobacteriota bacterium]